jgi:uncharacterized coiled-coil DUF342 family protein
MSEAEQSETAQQVAELTAELAEVRKKRDQLDAQNLRVTNNLQRVIEERDAVSEQLARCKKEVDMLAAENTSLRDTVESLRHKQIHPDLPGLLAAIQAATGQARELI